MGLPRELYDRWREASRPAVETYITKVERELIARAAFLDQLADAATDQHSKIVHRARAREAARSAQLVRANALTNGLIGDAVTGKG